MTSESKAAFLPFSRPSIDEATITIAAAAPVGLAVPVVS